MEWERCPLCDAPWLTDRCQVCRLISLPDNLDDPQLRAALEALAVRAALGAPASFSLAELAAADAEAAELADGVEVEVAGADGVGREWPV